MTASQPTEQPTEQPTGRPARVATKLPVRLPTKLSTRQPAKHRRHLISNESLARAARTRSDVDLTRARGQGNGLRVHGIYFAVVSVIGLVVVIVGVAIATSMMM